MTDERKYVIMSDGSIPSKKDLKINKFFSKIESLSYGVDKKEMIDNGISSFFLTLGFYFIFVCAILILQFVFGVSEASYAEKVSYFFFWLSDSAIGNLVWVSICTIIVYAFAIYITKFDDYKTLKRMSWFLSLWFWLTVSTTMASEGILWMGTVVFFVTLIPVIIVCVKGFLEAKPLTYRYRNLKTLKKKNNKRIIKFVIFSILTIFIIIKLPAFFIDGITWIIPLFSIICWFINEANIQRGIANGDIQVVYVVNR